MNETLTDVALIKPPRRFGRRMVRFLLLLLIPIAGLLAGGWWYVHGGRHVGTDNAYVKAGKATIAAEVTGRIAELLVTENQRVETGQALLKLDEENYRIALARAEAERNAAGAHVAALRAQIRQKREEIKLADIVARQAEREHLRGAALADRNVMSLAKLDEAKSRMESARQQMSIIRQEIERLVAELGGDEAAPVDRHPAVLQAQSMVDEARLALRRTVVTAPVPGIVTRVDSIKVGDYVRPGMALFSLVAAGQLWIEANFKETDLTHVVAGQPVEITIDTFPDVKLIGKVESLGAATGAEFSLIPPQNASGNWVKIVQRIPVRIALDDNEHLPKLRAGMSTQVTIDTGFVRPVPEPVAKVLARLGLDR